MRTLFDELDFMNDKAFNVITFCYDDYGYNSQQTIFEDLEDALFLRIVSPTRDCLKQEFYSE